MDAPDIRAIAALQQTVADLERELDAYRETRRAVDAKCVEQRETIASLRERAEDAENLLRFGKAVSPSMLDSVSDGDARILSAWAVVRQREADQAKKARNEAEARASAAEAECERRGEALKRLEWSFRQTSLRNGGTIYTATLCPACMGEKDPPDDKGPRRKRGDPLPPAGHKPDCWLARALAGERTP